MDETNVFCYLRHRHGIPLTSPVSKTKDSALKEFTVLKMEKNIRDLFTTTVLIKKETPRAVMTQLSLLNLR
jgi:hypothetical protein